MKTAIASSVLGFVVALWLTPLARRFAVRYRLVDRTGDGRRVNQKTTPRAGGLAIAGGVIAPVLALACYENEFHLAMRENLISMAIMVMGALAALGVGLADDLYRPSAKSRLMALIIIAVATWIGGHRVDVADLPFLGPVTMGSWSLPVTVLWIVGVIVAFNFVDGLDGLATGVALISTVTLFIYAQMDQNILWTIWTGAMAGALLGFLVFNFNPASIFMGDAGSNFLGYLLAVVALQTSRKQTTAVSLLVPMCVLGLPLLDVALTLVRRALLREGLFTSERGHLHHRLLHLGLSHRQAVLVLYAVTAVLCVSAISFALPLSLVHLIIAVIVALVVFSLMLSTGYIRPRDLLRMYHQGKANEARQLHVETACQELAQCCQNAGGTEVHLPNVLEELVERGCVSAVQFRCKHRCEIVAGQYRQNAKGSRLTIQSGRSGGGAVVIFWKDRAADPSPRESRALRKLFEGLECKCVTRPSVTAPERRLPNRPTTSAQLEKVWAALVESADRLSLVRIEFEIALPSLAKGFSSTWEKSPAEKSAKSWRIDVPVMLDAHAVGWLRVVGASGRQDIASLLDVLNTSESYLKSVIWDPAFVSLPMSTPHSDLSLERFPQLAGRPVEIELGET